MTKDEALKLALEALESGVDTQIGLVAWTEYDSCLISDAITAIKKALAQPEQAPVACRFCRDERGCWAWQCNNCGEIDDSQEPAPPQRTWVGLTDDEIEDHWDGYLSNHEMQMVRGILAKLKDKNT
jgi:hypothetical protein